VVVEMKNTDRRDRGVQRPDPLRCPACLLIRDYTLKDFRCTLARCPHTFVSIKAPGSQPAERGEHQEFAVKTSRSHV
jgi:hypothetical protein